MFYFTTINILSSKKRPRILWPSLKVWWCFGRHWINFYSISWLITYTAKCEYMPHFFIIVNSCRVDLKWKINVNRQVIQLKIRFRFFLTLYNAIIVQHSMNILSYIKKPSSWLWLWWQNLFQSRSLILGIRYKYVYTLLCTKPNTWLILMIMLAFNNF